MLFRMVLWWCSMMEVLLFSNDEKIFNLTNSVIDGRYKLTWCTYKSLEKNMSISISRYSYYAL